MQNQNQPNTPNIPVYPQNTESNQQTNPQNFSQDPRNRQQQQQQQPQQLVEQQSQMQISSNLHKIEIFKPIFQYEQSQNVTQHLKNYIKIDNFIYSPFALQNVSYQTVQDTPTKIQIIQQLLKIIVEKQLQLKNLYRNKYINPQAETKDHQHLLKWQQLQLKIEEFRSNLYINFQTNPFAFTYKNNLEILNDMVSNQWEKPDIRRFFIGKRVIKHDYYTQNNLVYKIKDVIFDLNPESQMNEQTTFKQYYEDKHELLIEDAEQPLFLVELMDFTVKKPFEKIYMVPQFTRLVVEDNNFKRYEMLREYSFSPSRPLQQVDDIKKFTKLMNNNEDFLALCSAWNIRINMKPQHFSYSFLDPGYLVIANSVEKKINDLVSPYGAGQFDHSFKMTFASAFQNIPKISNWLIIYYEEDVDLVDKFVNNISSYNQYYQYGIESPQYRVLNNLDHGEWIKELSNSENQQYQYILFVIRPEVDTPTLYRKTKEILTQFQGIPSQIIKSDTLGNFDFNGVIDVLANKFIVQMAAKMGGAPWVIKQLPFSDKPGAVLGINIQKSKQTGKIIITCCCSTNRFFSRYYNNYDFIDYESLTEDQIKQQISQKIAELTEIAINYFKSQHKVSLEVLIVFRDGAYLHNYDQEVQALNGMLNEKFRESSAQKYKMAYLTSKTISNPRFFIHNDYDSKDERDVRNSGIGTHLIDRDATDFYVMVKKESMGCSRMNNIKILHSDFPAETNDKIKSLTYKLCFINYAYSPLSVTMAPLQYAWKYAKFLEMLLPLDRSQQQQHIDQHFNNLKILNKRGSLFYL